MDTERDVMVTLVGREPMPTILAALQLQPAVVYGVYSPQTARFLRTSKQYCDGTTWRADRKAGLGA